MQLYKSKMAENFKNKYLKNMFNSFFITLLNFLVVEIVTIIVFTIGSFLNILSIPTMIISALLGIAVAVKIKRTEIKEYILSLFTVLATTFLLFWFFSVINSLSFGGNGYFAYLAVFSCSAITFYLFSLMAFTITSTITILKNIKNQDQGKLY